MGKNSLIDITREEVIALAEEWCGKYGGEIDATIDGWLYIDHDTMSLNGYSILWNQGDGLLLSEEEFKQERIKWLEEQV